MLTEKRFCGVNLSATKHSPIIRKALFGWKTTGLNGIVCDGLRGIFSLLSKYKVQMCQYHQVKIVKRYLTLQPELEASKELLKIINILAHSNKEDFIAMFER
jgi:hypothetical protein